MATSSMDPFLIDTTASSPHPWKQEMDYLEKKLKDRRKRRINLIEYDLLAEELIYQMAEDTDGEATLEPLIDSAREACESSLYEAENDLLDELEELPTS